MVATRLCDPLAVTLPLHSTPLEPPSSQETPARFGTQHISPVPGQSPGPPVLSPQIPFSQPTPSRIPETLIDSHTHRPSEVFSGSHTGNLAAGIAPPDISITGTDKLQRDISYLQDLPASSDMASAPYWPPHLTGSTRPPPLKLSMDLVVHVLLSYLFLVHECRLMCLLLIFSEVMMCRFLMFSVLMVCMMCI